MNRHDEKFYARRITTDCHTSPLPNSGGTPNDAVRRIVHNIFGHQPAAFSELQKRPRHGGYDLPGDDASRPMGKHWLAKHFYEECYEAPTIKRSDKVAVTVDEFIRRVVSPKGDHGRNTMSFIVGEVGVGKTSFINYLISKYGQSWVDQGIWFVRLDIEITTAPEAISAEGLLLRLARKTIRVLEANPDLTRGNDAAKEAQGSLNSCLPGDDKDDFGNNGMFAEIQEHYMNLIRYIQNGTNGRRLLLIIDDLDFYCHIRDRVLFENPGDTGEHAIIAKLWGFVQMFLHDGQQMGTLGANVLFSMRKSSYDLVVADHPNTSFVNGIHFRDSHTFEVDKPSLKQLYSSRIKLIEYAANEALSEGIITENQRSLLMQTPGLIENDLMRRYGNDSSVNLSGIFLGLTNYGYREMCDIFSRYAWIIDFDSASPFDDSRLQSSPPVSLYVYILGAKARFNQAKSHFPNIYLCDMQQKAVQNGSQEGPYSHEHRHTYWLKRLLLEYFAGAYAKSCAFKPSRVINTFHDPLKPTSTYERHLVSAALGSLNDANCSNVIDAKRVKSSSTSDRMDIDHVALNKRGYTFYTHIVDTFEYMEHVVDDWMISFPEAVLDVFSYALESHSLARGYSFLTEYGDSFPEISKEMAMLKAKQVLLFSCVLEKSWKLERTKYKPVFDELIDLHIVSDDFGSVIQK